MKLNRTGANWDRLERNKINENWDIIEGNYNNVVEKVSDEAYQEVVDAAKINWKEPVDSQNELPRNAEEGDTRQTRDTGKVYRYNGSAWVEIQQIDAGPVNELDTRLTQQLADSAQGLFSSGVKGAIKKTTPRPSLTIEDDDTRNELYTILYPFVKQKGIKISAAAITSRIETRPNYITIEQLVEMRDSDHIEFCNHTNNHVHLAELTDEEIDEEIRLAENFLNSHGIYSKHLVYPFGSVNDNVEEIASKYVNSATQSRDEINDTTNQLLRTYRVSRMVLERDIDFLKQKIDEAISANGWA